MVCHGCLPAGAFKFETKLEVLKLGWCKVGGGEGARAIADLLMYNKTLRQASRFERAITKRCRMCLQQLSTPDTSTTGAGKCFEQLLASAAL